VSPCRGALHRTLAVAAASMLIGSVTAAPVVHTVTIDGFEFHPSTVTVSKGDVVVWRNRDPVPHTATATAAGLDSAEIGPNGSFRFTATRAGRFEYVCTLHPTMKGMLVVD
jgi:plastocyanin